MLICNFKLIKAKLYRFNQARHSQGGSSGKTLESSQSHSLQEAIKFILHVLELYSYSIFKMRRILPPKSAVLPFKNLLYIYCMFFSFKNHNHIYLNLPFHPLNHIQKSFTLIKKF